MGNEERKTRADFATDSEWYTYLVTHPEESEEQVEQKKEYVKGIFICEKCLIIIDETEPNFKKQFGSKIERLEDGSIKKCPNCGGKLKRISKEYKLKVERERKKRKEKEEYKEIQNAKDLIKDDLIDLLEDLSGRVFDGNVTPNRFVVIFINLSKKIVDRYGKKLDIDWVEYRKSMLEMSQLVLDYNSFKENAESILEDYDENIEQDKLYLAEFNYYINDDKYSMADYELAERIEESNTLDQQLFAKERQKEAEEKYQERRKHYEEKYRIRQQNRLEKGLN